MENSLMKSNLKKIDFHSATTPLRPQMQTTDFFSSQKQKYDQHPKQSNLSTHNLSNIMLNSDLYHNQKELYDNQIPIKVKSHDREDYQTYLNIKLALISPSPSHNQILHFELTDESNHLFLYVMDLSETDFLTLKQEQSILVDFQGFPPRLVEMLELCMNMGSNKDDKTTFGCQLDIRNNGEASFTVIESNHFRVLPHMSLRFREATDQILKQFLAHRLTTEKNQNEELRIKVERLEETISQKTGECEKSQRELKKIQEDMDKKIQQLLLDEQKKLADDKQSSFDKETRLVREFDAEKKNLIYKHENTVRELQNKLETVSQNLQETQEIKMALEVKERELSNRLRLLEKESTIQQKEVESLRNDNKSLEKIRFEQEKSIAELSARCDNLDNQLKAKDELIAKNKELVDSSNSQKTILEENVATLKKANEKLEQKCQMCTEEINKGNEIIEKLQNDISNQKQKLKFKNTLVLQQETTITQNQETIDKLNKTVNELKRDNDSKDLRIKETEATIADLKSKLQQSQERIESSQNMINYLNQRINEGGKTMLRGSFVSGKYTPSSQQDEMLLPNSNPNAYTPGNKYAYSVNYEKYGKNYSTGVDNLLTATSTTPLTLSKTLTGGFATGTTTAEKSPIKTYDYALTEAGMTSTFNKENFNNTNRSVESNYNPARGYQNITNDLTSTSSIDMAYNRTMQPIKYKDPSAK